MALPNVSAGAPHVAAHNNERALINALQAVTDDDFVDALTEFVESLIPTPPTIPSNVITGDGSVTRVVRMTLEDYEALSVVDEDTLYAIVTVVE